MLHARRRQNAAGPYYPRLKIPGLRRRIRVSAAMGWQRPPGFAPRPPQEPVGPSPPRLRPDCYLARPIEYPTLPLKALGASSTRPAARGGGAGSTQNAWLSSDGEPAQSEYDGVCEKRIAWLQQAQIAPDCKTEGRPARPMAASEPRAAVLPDVSLAVTFRARLLPAFYITCFFEAVLVTYARRAAHSHWQNCKATGSDGNIDGGRGA
jgi:hypothetical protein